MRVGYWASGTAGAGVGALVWWRGPDWGTVNDAFTKLNESAMPSRERK